MEQNETTSLPLLLADTVMAFHPVRMERSRYNGWTPERQARFILALEAMGSVGNAARAVSMSRMSAYRLRDRPDAASFAQAWDQALHLGEMRIYSYAMERALDGVTTIRVKRGGSVSVESGPDMQLVNAALREIPRSPKSY